LKKVEIVKSEEFRAIWNDNDSDSPNNILNRTIKNKVSELDRIINIQFMDFGYKMQFWIYVERAS
jgi:hypothetical protein